MYVYPDFRYNIQKSRIYGTCFVVTDIVNNVHKIHRKFTVPDTIGKELL